MGDRVNRLTHIIPFAALLLATGCASGSDYPSLALRPAERIHGSFSSVAPAADSPTDSPPPVAPLPANAALSTRIDALVGEAQAAHTRFMAAAPRAQRLAATAGGIGSDSWASAQVALADLESQRSQAAIALSTLDELHIDAVVANNQPAIISTAREAVISLIGQEDTLLSQLRTKVRG